MPRTAVVPSMTARFALVSGSGSVPDGARADCSVADVPDELLPEPRRARRSATRYEVAADRPTRAVLLSGLPSIMLVLVVVYLFATFFPALGALLLVVIPVAVIAALVVGAFRTRRIKLVVTDEVVKVTNGKAGTACLRSDIHTAVVVERFARRPLSPRTTNLILLNEQGRTLLMLGGLLWPVDVLRRVIAMVEPAEVVDVPGRQTPKTLAARFPRILERADPEP